MKMKRWVTAAPDLDKVRSLAHACGLTPLAACCIVRTGT